MKFAEQFSQQQITRTTQAIEEARRRQDETSEQMQQLALRLFTAVWQRTERLHFAESACAMVADLAARTSPLALRRMTAAYSLPTTPLWIALAQPIVPSFDKYTDFVQPAVAALHWLPVFDEKLAADIARIAPAARVTDVLAAEQHHWLLDLISPEREIVFSLAFARDAHTWGISPVHRCPFGLCGNGANGVCPLCARWQWYWQLRFPLMLMVKDQLFAESCVVTETVLRRMERVRSGKKRTIAVPSSYRVIDASTKTIREVREALFPRGSWLARHDPDEIEYVEKLVRPFIRTYRSERYKNVRGQTVQITPKLPRHIPTLKDRRRITKVIASDYEGGKDTPPSI